jgi:excisionase family DNA binding protein
MMSERGASEMRQERTTAADVSGAADTWPRSAAEVAALLDISERTIRRAIARGELVATKRGGIFQITATELARFQLQRGGAREAARSPLRLVSPEEIERPALPARLSSFVGRSRESVAAMELLQRPEVRLLTLTGPGGVGKTRLSLEVASRLSGQFSDGEWFVELAPVRSPELVLPAIALALGLRESGDKPLSMRLHDFLRPRTLLLVLDNLEHLLDAAPGIAKLLSSCPNVKILATSRAPLRIQGEQEFAVPPLKLPELEEDLSLAEISAVDSVALFAERARSVKPGFAMTAANAPAIAAICRRVDGLPLAIELAASWISLLSPAALSERLERQLPVLTSGARDRPARLKTMRDAIAWSHDLLTADEQVLFRRLAVFVGGAPLAAVERFGVVFGQSGDAMFDGLSSLVRQSLLLSEEVAGDSAQAGMTRLRMLEPIREFAQERLSASGEEERVRSAHAAWCLGLVEASEPHWFTANQLAWAERLEPEHGNLRAALEWFAARGDTVSLLRMCAVLWRFWFLRSHYEEGRAWLVRALAGSAGMRTRERAWALNGAASLGVFQWDPRVSAWCEESLAISQEIDFLFGAANAQLVLGHVALLRGDYERANHMQAAALTLMREIGAAMPIAKPATSLVLGNLAEVAVNRGEYTRAARLAKEAFAIQREIGFGWGAAQSLYTLASSARHEGDARGAAALYRESLDQAWDQRDHRLILRPLDYLAVLAAEAGQCERAARLFGAAAHLRELLGTPLDPAEQPTYDRAIATARNRLSGPVFDVSWALGWALPLPSVIAEASWHSGSASSVSQDASGSHFGLTRRERQVLQLLVAGQTDREIGETLFTGRRTVETHVRGILNKLGLTSRSAVGAYAVRHGLA